MEGLGWPGAKGGWGGAEAGGDGIGWSDDLGRFVRQKNSDGNRRRGHLHSSGDRPTRKTRTELARRQAVPGAT